MREQDRTLLDKLCQQIEQLMLLNESLSLESKRLHQELLVSQVALREQTQKCEQLQQQLDYVKVSKVLSLSSGDRLKSKAHINKLIREIDACIAQLND